MRGRNAFSDLISRLSCSDFQCCASPGADVIQQVSVKRRTDNPKYRRIVPRGRVAIRRQFILKSRGIGRDWSGESGAASSAAFGVVKYSRRGAVIPKVFQPIRGGGKRQLRRAEGEREDSSMGRLIAREQTRFFLPASFPFVAALLTPPMSSIHLSHYSSLPPSYPPTDNTLPLFARWTSIN